VVVIRDVQGFGADFVGEAKEAEIRGNSAAGVSVSLASSDWESALPESSRLLKC
jgi:hypothetical protein